MSRCKVYEMRGRRRLMRLGKRDVAVLIGVITLAPVFSAERPATASMGTGWPVAQGYVVTNNHVVVGQDTVTLMRTNGKSIKATVALRDAHSDLALLKPENPQLLPPALPLSSASARLGENIFTIGFPHTNVMGKSPKLSIGIVNSKTGMADDLRTMQISVPLHAGDSGGPLFNMHGEVVGITTSKLNAVKMFKWTGDMPQNVNYAVKVNYLKILLDSLDQQTSVIKEIPPHPSDLTDHADRLQDSILIVVSNGQSQQFVANKTIVNAPFLEPVKKSTLLVVYAEPGVYDIQRQDPESNTIKSYSSNLSKSIEEYLFRRYPETVTVADKIIGDLAKPILYDAEEQSKGEKFCQINKADSFIVVRTEANPGYNFRYVSFSIFDCVSKEKYRKNYSVLRISDDRFAYENELRSKFRQFLSDLPSRVQLASNSEP